MYCIATREGDHWTLGRAKGEWGDLHSYRLKEAMEAFDLAVGLYGTRNVQMLEIRQVSVQVDCLLLPIRHVEEDEYHKVREGEIGAQ